MKSALPLLSCLLLSLLLTGCAPKPLPEGMEEEDVLAAGHEVVELLVSGSFEEAAGLFRSDIDVSADVLRSLMDDAAEGIGFYKGLRDSMATGRTVDGTDYGEAVILCQYQRDDVLFRVCFDTDMVLVGLEITKQ